ncbi:MAG: hypothetical protein U0457_09050 [Candidatus Sericytochromatia bacterium]
MEKDEKFKEIAKRHSKCFYYEYELNIVDETTDSFIINNGDGESVSKNQDINIQFMLIKDTLGFEQIDKGTFQKEVSKLDDNLQLKALKLVYYKSWLVRVIQEKDDKYLLVCNTNKPEDSGWFNYDKTYLKWVVKSEIKELQDFISYWKK